MAKDESFDITTGCDLQEVANAVNQARKEISTRFDFKNVTAEIDYEHGQTKIGLHAADDYKLEAMWQVLSGRMIARNVPVKNMIRETPQKAAQGTIRQDVNLVQGIEQDIAKKIVRFVKDQKYKKAQAQVQGDAVRVSAPSRDELQLVMKDLKAQDYGIELKFGNYR
ncbi:MAG: YajQ family cyclic di-GMP-binding protein [Dehalococcoidia bacterium]